MTKRGHVPVRTCVVCGGKGPRSKLLRMVLDPSTGLIVKDSLKVKEGRGAYACPECLRKVQPSRRIHKAFRGKVKGVAKDMAGI